MNNIVKNVFIFQLILFVALLLLWNIFIPVLEGADESGHLCTADYIAHRNKIPNLNIQDSCFLVYQPLYYLTLVPIIQLFHLSEFKNDTFKQNPNFNLLRRGQYAQYIHGTNELYLKWNKFEVMVHTLRFVSSIFGILIFVLAWNASLITFKKENLRYLSMLLFFNPMFIHIFSTLTNVTLISLIAAVIIYIEIYHADKKNKHIKIILFEGLLFGLGNITKISIFTLGIAYIFIFIKRWVQYPQKLNKKIIEILVILTGFLLISGWYMIRSFKLYGEPLEINIAHTYAGGWHWTLLSRLGPLNFWNSFAITIIRTFWSDYAALTIRLPMWVISFLLLISIISLFGVYKAKSKLNSQLKICIYYTLSIFFGLMVVNLKTASMHAKDLFPAYIPLALLFSFGLSQGLRVIKIEKLSRLQCFIIFLIVYYFFAQEEIVIILKNLANVIFQNNISIDIFKIGTTTFVKCIIVILFIRTMYFAAKNISFKRSQIITFSFLAFISNLLIIVYANYLLYIKF